jgi:uncharacterized protein YukE
MTAVQGSVPFPAVNAEGVMALATNLGRVARLLDANVRGNQQAKSATVGAGRWTGQAGDAFGDSADRRVDHAARASVALSAVGEVLARHGSVMQQTQHAYGIAAQGELYLRRNHPNATAEITASMDAEAQNVSALYQSAASMVDVIREAINELSQMTNRANVDAVRPEVQRQTADDNGFGLDDVVGGVAGRGLTLDRIERGTLTPSRTSRLGAYAATVGYPEGSVGHAVHRAIGTIYLTMGTVGEEQIGVVFNSAEARDLFDKPLNEQTSRRIAEIEFAYWRRVRDENALSTGGQLGSAFKPWFRDLLQRDVFGTEASDVPVQRRR